MSTTYELSLSDRAQLEQVVNRFEDAWQRGERPAIDEYLPPGPLRAVVLVELVHVDLERRLEAGGTSRVEDYLGRYPELQADVAVLVDLVATEYELRRGDSGRTPEDYLKRFPQVADVLRGRFEQPEPASPATHPEQPSPDRAQTDPWATLPITEPAALAVGPLHVPGYEILGELGRGGMGVVYKARQIGLNRLVALKMIRDGQCAGEEERARFRTEAKAVAHLQHPNIVQIHEVGEHAGRAFFSLEYVDAGTLADRLNDRPLPPAEAARLVATLAEAMQVAHQCGVVHRDLKPANVLLASVGGEPAPVVAGPGNSAATGASSRPPLASLIPKITDFGLAKCLDEAGRTRSGSILGTPSYMAPEQARGEQQAVGPAADVYALGAILYEALTGRPPFKAATVMETVLQVISDEPVTPRRLQPGVPRDLETICLKCLQKEPLRRYARAADLAEDLHRFLNHEPIRARPVGMVARTLKWTRRRPLAAALLAVCATAAATVLVIVLQYHARLQAERDIAAHGREEAEAARAQTEVALAESRRRLALSFPAYSRVCALAAHLANAADSQDVAAERAEFRKLYDWMERFGDPAIQPTLEGFEGALRRWDTGSPPAELHLRQKSLALAHACRDFWLDALGRDLPAAVAQIRAQLYERASATADRLATARSREEVRAVEKDFWDLYWGELAIVESKEVETAMVNFGAALQTWQDGESPAKLRKLAEELRRACGVPR